jgi:anti-sigma regulatory factor (Ser/Thr protein kinase)
LHLRLHDEPEAASIARRLVGAALAGVSAVDGDVVTILVSELVARVARLGRAGEGIADVHLDVNDVRVRVHVTGPAEDDERDRDAERDPAITAGWGLLLLERATDRWGIDEGPATRVWFEIDVAADGREATATGPAPPYRGLGPVP